MVNPIRNIVNEKLVNLEVFWLGCDDWLNDCVSDNILIISDVGNQY